MKFGLTAGVVAVALSFGGVAVAGGLDEPLIEPTVIEEATVPSGHDVLVPIVALVLIGAALAAAD